MTVIFSSKIHKKFFYIKYMLGTAKEDREMIQIA